MQNSTIPTNDLITIILPVYNVETFIKQTIASIQAQTHYNWECLIIDDCSQDRTMEIVSHLITNDKRFILYQHKSNQGVSAARNLGLDFAKGEYIAFLDGDDIWNDKKLQLQLEFMKQNNCMLSYTAYKVINNQGELVKSIQHVPEGIRGIDLIGNTAIATSSVMIRRVSIHHRFVNGPLFRAEDLIFWLDWFLLNPGCVSRGVPSALTTYRLTQNSLSRSKWKSVRAFIKVIRSRNEFSYSVRIFKFFSYVVHGLIKHSIFKLLNLVRVLK